MTERSERPFVGRATALAALREELTAARGGPRAVLLAGQTGDGRAALMDRFLERAVDGDTAVALLRVRARPEDDGVRTLLRVYGSFLTGLLRPKAFGEDPADLIEAAAEGDEDPLAMMAETLRTLRTHTGGNAQIQLPRDNPYVHLIRAFDVLGPQTTWVVDLHEVGAVLSPAFWVYLSVLVGRARARNLKVLFVVAPGLNRYSETPDDRKPGPMAFIRQLFGEARTVEIGKLAADEIAELLGDTYRPHRFPEGLAARLADLSQGRPEDLHELLDALEEDETITWDDKGYALSDLDDVDLDVLVPMAQEDDEGDVDEELLEKVLHVASLAGPLFPGTLVRSVLAADDDDVDDALDSMPHLVEELRHDEALGSWLYRFRYGFTRRWYRDNPPAALKGKAQELRRELATVMMQSYAPASFEWVPRAAELFAEAGEGAGGRALLGMALGTDRGELGRFAIELGDRFADSPWPEGLLRLLHASAADRAVNGGTVEAANEAIDRAAAWAATIGDADTQAFCELLRCRTLIRQGDLDGARTQGEAALAAFEALGDATRCGETLNQLAMVAINQGRFPDALQFVQRGAQASTIPPVKAHGQYIVGLVEKARGNLPAALEAFTRSTELSSRAGNLALVLESMLNEGEVALALGQVGPRIGLLERALEMSRALRSPHRERIAARLLCQAEAARGRAEQALEVARHALQLTRDLGLTAQEDVDLYHCGLFSVMAGKKAEGLEFLQAARQAAEAGGNQGLLPEIAFNLAQIRLADGDFEGARTQMEQTLAWAREKGDRLRELRVLEQIGLAMARGGDLPGAVARLKEAADLVPPGPQWKEYRTSLHQRLAQAQSAASKAADGPA